MLLTAAEMQSPILRAGLILLVRVAAKAAGEWHATPGRFEQRSVEVGFVIERVLKGDAALAERLATPAEDGATAEGDAITTTITQFRPRGPRYIAVPGVWSSLDIEVGFGFVTFSAATSDVAAALRDPLCFHVGPESSALPDTEMALAAGMPPIPIGLLLARNAARRSDFGVLFARTIVDRVVETFFDDLPGFEQVLATAADPALPSRIMLLIMRGVCDALLRHEPAPEPFVAHFLAAVATIAGRPATDNFRTMMFQTYVPNLLGIVGGLPRRPANLVFAPDRPERASLRAALAHDPQVAAPLLAWLEE